MTQTQPTPATPARRPVGHGRALVEGGAILTPFATILAWALGLLPFEIPTEVKHAFVGLVVTLGTLAFSEWRNRKYSALVLANLAIPKAMILGPALLAVVAIGCATWDGSAYGRLAGDEIVTLRATAEDAPIDPARCAAHVEAASALRDGEGTSRSPKLPLFAGPKIPELADHHERLGVLCYELERRDRERGVAPAHRQAVRADWIRAWTNGRALQGGPEE